MQLLPPQRGDLGAERGDLVVLTRRGLTRGEEASQTEKNDRCERKQQGRNQSSCHHDSKFGNCSPRSRVVSSFAIGDTPPPRLYRLEQLAGMLEE
jgi:hypothetical protein